MKNRIFTLCILLITIIVCFCGCTVKIKNITVEAIPKLKVDENHQIKYSFEPKDATDKTVIFESSDKKIATVDNQGKIKALAPGEIEIRVFPNDEKRTSSNEAKTSKVINVKVVQPVTSIDCKHDLIVAIGNVEGINAKALPENSSDKTIVYKSSDETVATVDDKGNVTGIKKGNVIITATSPDGVTANCQVNVKQPITSIGLNKQSINLSVNGTTTVNAILKPKDADYNSELIFSSSDNSIVSIDQNGKIKAVSVGKATITVDAKDKDGKSLTAKCVVIVKSSVSPVSPVTPTNNSTTKRFIIEKPVLPCMWCHGQGYMLSGVQCYLCDYWETD